MVRAFLEGLVPKNLLSGSGDKTPDILMSSEEHTRPLIDEFFRHFDEVTGTEEIKERYAPEEIVAMRTIAERAIATVRRLDPEKRATWSLSMANTDPDGLPLVEGDLKDYAKQRPEDPVSMLGFITRTGRLRHDFKKLLLKLVDILDRFEKRAGK